MAEVPTARVLTAAAQSEFSLIEACFAPLSRQAPGAYGLKDDAAHLVSQPEGHVLTVDQVIEGTHFLSSDPLGMIAQKLVRRSLSDLIAKGAKPIGALLTLAWPNARGIATIVEFADGLGRDLEHLCGNCALLGGDTSRTDGPLVATLTLIGVPLSGRKGPVLRSGAKPGDYVCITGKIGQSYLGLQCRLGNLDPADYPDEVAISLRPEPPPMTFANVVAQFATASIDVSDGLLADLSHLATASNVGISMTDLKILDDGGLFPAERQVASNQPQTYDAAIDRLFAFLTGGDDYQTLCTVHPEQFNVFREAAFACGVRVTLLGRVTPMATASAPANQPQIGLTYKGAMVDLPVKTGWSI